jgi:hypothetical protein
MINFENNMLVLNNVFSKEDVNQINAYTDYVRKEERERILNILYNKGLELEKDVSLDDEASRTRYLFMLDIIEIVKNSGHTKDAS